MKTRTGDFQAEQSAYLLEYDRRRILNCADTFRSLAAVLTGMNLEEEDGEEGSREQRLQKRRAQEDRKNYAAYLRQVAGLMQARSRAGAVISMDADLQDDIEAVDQMVDKYLEGCDIVYGVRSSRRTDSFFKRFTAEGFYRMMNALGAETVFNHADYRLMSRRALDGLAEFREVNLFLRGIVPMIGYRTDTVEYERHQRFAGESKYPLKKMVAFAAEGITSLSTRPLKMIAGLGFLVFMASLVMLAYIVVRWASGHTITGWASLSCSLWAIGGLILLSLGVIGEYIGKIYLETKGRPRFLIREVLDDEEADG